MRVSGTFWKSKTTWTGIVAIITAVGAFITKTISLTELAVAIFTALQTMNIRDTLAKRD